MIHYDFEDTNVLPFPTNFFLNFYIQGKRLVQILKTLRYLVSANKAPLEYPGSSSVVSLKNKTTFQRYFTFQFRELF